MEELIEVTNRTRRSFRLMEVNPVDDKFVRIVDSNVEPTNGRENRWREEHPKLTMRAFWDRRSSAHLRGEKLPRLRGIDRNGGRKRRDRFDRRNSPRFVG